MMPEVNDETLFKMKRTIKVIFDDEDYLFTWINGTKKEIRRYYIGQTFEIDDTKSHKCVDVEFLD